GGVPRLPPPRVRAAGVPGRWRHGRVPVAPGPGRAVQRGLPRPGAEAEQVRRHGREAEVRVVGGQRGVLRPALWPGVRGLRPVRAAAPGGATGEAGTAPVPRAADGATAPAVAAGGADGVIAAASVTLLRSVAKPGATRVDRPSRFGILSPRCFDAPPRPSR